jgi:hypothetical protein
MQKFDDIKENVIQEFPGELGLKIGGKEVVEIPTRPGFVYVRLRSNLNEIIQAYNDRVANVYGLKVRIARDKVNKSRWYVVGKDTGIYQDWGNSAYLPDHHEKHEFNPDGIGQDIVWVYSQQLMPFLIYPSGSSALYYSHPYYDGNDWSYSGLQLVPDLSTYKPTGSNAKIALVYIDNDDHPALLAGGDLSESSTGTADIINALPSLPTATARPLAAIRLLSGTSSLEWSDIYDLRQFIGGGGGGGGGANDKVKVSLNDTTAGYLNGKLIAGNGIVLTENNDGSNETLTIAITGSSGGGGHTIQDEGTPLTQRQNLNFVGSSVFVEDDAGNDATIVIVSGSAGGGGDDERVKVSANDTTAGYLNGKLVAGTRISLTEINDGSNETLRISYTGTGTSGGGRELLTADREYYVALDGNDNNSGLSSGDAFATINKAITLAANELDLAGYNLTINVGTGTFSENVLLFNMVGQRDKGGLTTGNVILRGAGPTGTNSTTIEATIGSCILANGSSTWWQIENFRLTKSGGAQVNGIGALNNSFINFSDIYFDGPFIYNVLADNWSYIKGLDHILGGGTIGTHVLSRNMSSVNFDGTKIYFAESITGSNFFSLGNLSNISISLAEFNLQGYTFTGNKYGVQDNSVINAEYGEADFIPGTSGWLENNGVVRGLPSKVYLGDIDDLKALTNVIKGSIAYTDGGDQLGIYNGSEWTWSYLKPNGWIPANETWTYNSSTSVKVTGDVRDKYAIGDKIKLYQNTGGDKYFYIRVISYSGSPPETTTISFAATSDYSLADEAITSNFFSHSASPVGFPEWFNWTATFSGWSSNPSDGIYRYRIDGKTVTVNIFQPNNGTSNSTGSFIGGLPVSKSLTDALWLGLGIGLDNGATLSSPIRVQMGPGSGTLGFYTSFSGGAWTASGNKRIITAHIEYEIE